MIKWGSTEVRTIKWGSTTCTKVYWGSILVYPNALGYYYGQIDSSMFAEITRYATSASVQSDHLLFTQARAQYGSWMGLFQIKTAGDFRFQNGQYVRVRFELSGFNIFKPMVASRIGSSPTVNSSYMEIENNVRKQVNLSTGYSGPTQWWYIGCLNYDFNANATLKIYEIDLRES